MAATFHFRICLSSQTSALSSALNQREKEREKKEKAKRKQKEKRKEMQKERKAESVPVCFFHWVIEKSIAMQLRSRQRKALGWMCRQGLREEDEEERKDGDSSAFW